MDMIPVIDPAGASLYGEEMMGGKAKNLAWMTRNGFPVPGWFVVTTDAFRLQLEQDNLYAWIQEELAGAADDTAKVCAAIQQRIRETPIHPLVRDAVMQQLGAMDGWEERFFAVRSSAVGEDSGEASFAGQMDSFLFQKGEEAVMASVINCFAGAFSERAVRYRLHHGMDVTATRAAVIIQEMINSDKAGVFFTAHPVTGSRRHGLLSACYGSGEGVVSGVCNTDEFTVDLHGETIERNINVKDRQVVFDREHGRGTIETGVDEDLQKVSCLTDAEIRTIKETGRRIAEKLQFPQDIEWCISGDSMYILQTRPVTSLPAPAEPRGERLVWDNSNIQESYCGVTTPLTFSYASFCYSIVYHQTYRVLKVPEKTLERLQPVFKNLLGLIRGRVYYNINNWYRALLILPSFKTNKEDMERMMGLQDPVDLVEEQELTFAQRMRRVPGLLRALVSLKAGFRNIDRLVGEFRDMFEKEYRVVDRSRLHTMEIAELLDLHDYIVDNVLYKWQTPIINDFYVMMMNGKVHRWLEKAGVEHPVIVQNNLMSGEEGIESTEPTKYLLRMCGYIRQKPRLHHLVNQTPNECLLDVIQGADSELYEKCLEYIELYGDRCMGELKLESVTLRHDPSFLFAVLRNYLAREDMSIETLAGRELEFRKQAEEEAFSAVKDRLGRRKLRKFKKELGRLRQAVKNRENMRLARTRAFGLSRDIFLEVGRQLAFYGLLEDQRDIFYLTLDELQQYRDGRSVQAMFRPLVKTRKAEYRAYKEDDLPHHFETVGPVYHHNSYEYGKDQQVTGDETELQGIGCYPGVVEEKVKLIFSPDDELNLDGQILCTVRTDPGWAPLFPTAGGIIVERGSTLSHSAVVARELGIPAIVNIPGITRIITSGERVRMDGTRGTVFRIDGGSEGS